MKSVYAVLGAFLVAVACAPTSAGTATAPVATLQGGCTAFPDALRACAPSSCGQPHVFAPNFTIEHRITGIEDNACVYTQSMPGEMTMACRLSESGRDELATDMEEFQRTGELSFSFSTEDPTPETAMTRECQIRDRDGNIIPWGTSQR